MKGKRQTWGFGGDVSRLENPRTDMYYAIVLDDRAVALQTRTCTKFECAPGLLPAATVMYQSPSSWVCAIASELFETLTHSLGGVGG